MAIFTRRGTEFLDAVEVGLDLAGGLGGRLIGEHDLDKEARREAFVHTVGEGSPYAVDLADLLSSSRRRL